ncbi:hypothetical protein GPJ56_000488 [Histomonas meleagridis]|uniref:uncharacterized protein n=1 Tax=Histomonas meleagridis TaxID=135588 RepID=UPI003559663A|nr:hypothetical protein GPJ56_000488 [Histomonas meleagridis]KAH0796471.1 hypothetical protein GO595_010364 [Histomonas meleagridis]
METVSPMTQENQAISIIQHHFLRLRQTENNKSSLTEDISYTASFLNINVNDPVSVLKSMGIIFFGPTAAFNLSLLQSQVICCRAVVLSAFYQEGWTDVESKDTNLSAVVGANQVKNWIVLKIPQQSNLTKLINENPRLIATEQSFGLDHTPDEILIGPGMPPQDVLTEPHFPLVTIQYEWTFETHTIATFDPLENAVKNRKKLNISQCEHTDIE